MLVFAKSLKAYRERFNSRFAVRTAMTGLRTDNGLVNLPLFALPSFSHVIRTDREDWRDGIVAGAVRKPNGYFFAK